MKHIFVSCLLFSLGTFSLSAATFTVTPNVVSNNYTGLITFQMNGLSAGETVQVEEFFDANNNGIVDAGEFGVRFETVTDGQLKLIAGVPNPNAFQDQDGAANGAITAAINFALAPDTERGLGNYLFRISSPSNHFTATNLSFTVSSPPYTQSVQGTVKNNSTNVPFAVVALTQQGSSGDTIVIAGNQANSTGSYSIPAPPGTYQVLAFRAGYVNYLTNFPTITLASNATVTTNLNLMVANTTLSGSLVDSTNFALPAVPDSELLAFSTNSLITLAVANSNGQFTIPVTSNNVWSVRPFIQSALPEGYLPVEQGNEARFQTFTGPVSSAFVTLKRATAVLYGKVLGNHSNSIPAIGLGANGDGGQYDGAAFSDGNGNYFMAMDGGSGFIEVANSGNPPANNFIWTGTFFSVNNGQAANVNVTGIDVTARFRAHITSDTGAPLSNLFCVAECPTGDSFGTTDANGFLDMPMYASTWQLLNLATVAYPNLVFPAVPPFTITDGVNFTNNVIARTATGQIFGQVRNASSVGISNILVTVTNSVGATNFVLGTQTDVNGNYSKAVFNGTWNVSLDAGDLQNAGYNPVTPLNVLVPPTNAMANFNAEAIPPPEIITTNLPDSVLENFYFVELDATNGVPGLIWSLDSGTLPGGLEVGNFGIGVISGTITNFGLFNFTVRVTDAKGQFATQALSINVLATTPGPLTITTMSLPSGAVGCTYSNQIQATGGTPPYSWALATTSSPLPDGLGIGTDGTVSGIPTTSEYASVNIQVSDSGGGFATQMVSLSVNTALEVFPGPLSGSTLGSSYYGLLSAEGGQQPQTWSIISGSLPPSFTLNPATGEIIGTAGTLGTYSFTARVTDGCATQDLDTSITIFTTPMITTTTLPIASPGVNYSAQLTATGGDPPYYFYTSDPLPGSMTLDYAGLLSGESFVEGTTSFLVQVYDSVGGGSTALLTLICSSQPVLDSPVMTAPNQFSFHVTGVSGQSYTAQYTADLTNWIELYTTNAPDTQFFITDTNAADDRFYRLRVN